MASITYTIAQTANEFQQGRKLFIEYAESLSVDLSFQQFEKELELIDEEYNKPHGALIIAYTDHLPIACTGVRKFEKEIAELKRMYVKPEFRGYKIGITLLEHSIRTAKELGYKRMRLDTLHNMNKAQQLYRAFGFYEIQAYRFNPLAGTIYMEKTL